MKSFKQFITENVAEIQFQDLSGTWKPILRTINQPIFILKAMTDYKKINKEHRVRAIDPQSGQLLDIMP